MKKHLIEFYLSYVNKYLTSAGIAEAHGLPLDYTRMLIQMGREMHAEQVMSNEAKGTS